MKKLITSITILFLSIASFAQVDKKAQEILKGVSAKYKSYKAIKADFSYTLENTAEKIKDTQNGNITLKGNKYKLLIAGQEITSDGSIIWTYNKEAKELQINTVDPSQNEINPAEIFTMYEKGFLYKFNGEKIVSGKTEQTIELTPTDKTKEFFKVMLVIDKGTKQILRSTVFDKGGNRYTYSIKTFTPNPPVTDADFTYDKKKYPGVEVVDLR
jgi:outer membrane lipoprotein-sorting protein